MAKNSKKNANVPPERVINAAAGMQARQNVPSGGWQNGYVPQSQYQAQQQYYAQQPGNAPQQRGWQVGQNTGSYQTTGSYRPEGQWTRGYTPVLQGGGPSSGMPGGNRNRKKGFPAWIFVLVLAALVACVMIFGVKPQIEANELADKVTPYDNLFCEGVWVDGIHLGGMTPEQAYNSVVSQINQRHDAWKVSLTYNGQIVGNITADMLGMSVDIGSVLNEAWKRGHTDAQGYVLSNKDRLEAMEQLKTEPFYAYTAVPSGDNSVIDTILGNLKAQIDTPASDAALLRIDATLSYPFVFQEETYGRVLNTEPVKEQLYHMVSVLQSGSVDLVPETIAPSVTVVDLKQNYELRSSMYTPIATSSTEYRNENIRVAFSKFNGYVLNPGKSFSFNSVVGERTEKAGFKPAVEYVYGEHVEGIGGGVCQASTTLYQAVVCAGLQVTKRSHHSDAVGYTELGKDATVYWVGKRKIDLVFKNNTDAPVYIFASVQADPSNKKRLIARVSIYGKYMEGVRYEIETKTVQILDPPTEPVYVKDTNGTYVTYTDQQKSVSKPAEGYVVESYRVKYVDNEVTDRKLLYTDTFNPKPERIYVGVKKRN